MICGINAGIPPAGGYGPLSPYDIQDIVWMKRTGVRTEIRPHITRQQARETLQPFVGSSLRLLVLLGLEQLRDRDQAETHARMVLDEADALNVEVDVEPLNEPDLADIAPSLASEFCEMVLRVTDEYPNRDITTYGGSARNTYGDALAYMEAMPWRTMSERIQVAIHRYAPMNDPHRSHCDADGRTFEVALQHEIVGIIEATGKRPPPIITEMGYHTATSTPEWSKDFPPKYYPGGRLSNGEAAAALVRDHRLYASWGVPRVDIFQINCGVPRDQYDYEALYGVRDATDTRGWLPQAYALEAMEAL